MDDLKTGGLEGQKKRAAPPCAGPDAGPRESMKVLKPSRELSAAAAAGGDEPRPSGRGLPRLISLVLVAAAQ